MLQALIPTLAGKILDLIGGHFSSKDEAEKAAREIAAQSLREAHELAIAQLQVNKQEAKSQSLFVAGWRPFVGWSCGSCFAWNYALLPVVKAIAAIAGASLALAPADLTLMMPVLMGMMGLRSFEKYKDIDAKSNGS